MAITGTGGSDTITPAMLSAGVAGGSPGLAADVIFARAGADSVDGGGGDDYLYGEEGDDTLLGGAGTDVLDGGTGADSMAGGAGNDIYVVDNAGDAAVEIAGEGTDTLYASLACTIQGAVEIGRLFGGGTYLEVAAGSAYAVQLVVNPTLASTLAGGAGDDVLWGGTAGAVLYGRSGSDILRDQSVAATLIGGSGDDQYVVGSAGSVIIEAAGEGTDTAWVTIGGYTLPANVEIGRLSGMAATLFGSEGAEQLVANPTANGYLAGNGGDDVLWGSARFDVLDGGDGADTFRGQGGADQYIGGRGNDQFVVFDSATVITENPGEGYDTIWLSLSGTDPNLPYVMPDGVEQIYLGGTGRKAIGNALDNVIVGIAGVTAGAMVGADGNDTLFGGAGGTRYQGSAGDDVIYAQGSFNTYYWYPGEGGFDRIVGMDGIEDRLVLVGSSAQFGPVSITYAAGNTQVHFLDTTVLIYNTIVDSSVIAFTQ